MDFYNKYILPKVLNFMMKNAEMEKQRVDVVSQASGLVLEIGFGSGLNLPYYKNIIKLYALDPSRESYDLAREQAEQAPFKVEYIHASAEEVPLASHTIDFVVSTWNLCSIPHPDIALKEIFRILKPGGRFIFIEHGKSPKGAVAKIQKLLTPISKSLLGGCHLDREIDRLIGSVGFEIEKLERFQQKTRWLAFMYRGVAVAKK